MHWNWYSITLTSIYTWYILFWGLNLYSFSTKVGRKVIKWYPNLSKSNEVCFIQQNIYFADNRNNIDYPVSNTLTCVNFWNFSVEIETNEHILQKQDHVLSKPIFQKLSSYCPLQIYTCWQKHSSVVFPTSETFL